MDKEQEAIDLLKSYNQNHIINLLKKLDEVKKQELIEQISDLPIMAIDHRRYGRAHLIFLQKYQSDRKG